MCGIVGYTGLKQADLVLVPALQRLEYRGYDSAGLATIHQGRIQLRKSRENSQSCAITARFSRAWHDRDFTHPVGNSWPSK